MLYRISISEFREQFVLKGALLFDLWFDEPHRPTRDADFLGFGTMDAESLTDAIRKTCVIEVDDGMVYDPATARAVEIRGEANYGGLRVTLRGQLGKADSLVQLDVGYGDAVTPGPVEAELPLLLDDQPAALLRVYPRETVVSEKLEAIVKLGMINSRMKDYFDLHALRVERATDGGQVARAIAETFKRRGSAIPESTPIGLSDDFSADKAKRIQWAAFLRKNRLESPPLDEVVEGLSEWLVPLMRDAARAADSGVASHPSRARLGK